MHECKKTLQNIPNASFFNIYNVDILSLDLFIQEAKLRSSSILPGAKVKTMRSTTWSTYR